MGLISVTLYNINLQISLVLDGMVCTMVKIPILSEEANIAKIKHSDIFLVYSIQAF